MLFSPFETFEHLKESLCSYLETAYKISNPLVFSERGFLLRREALSPTVPAVSQDPFIESTPAFPGSRYLSDVIQSINELPSELLDLAAIGMPVKDFPLYDHQLEALQRAYSNTPNLVVATGTGSGKTEIFLLVILAEILSEALTWSPPIRDASPGTYNSAQHVWLHRRLHERRQFATRSIILYPMNALVNDQVQRLRRILADPISEDWQKSKFKNNLIYFGMYTGDTEPTGHWARQSQRDRWSSYIREALSTWDKLSPERKKRGNWPRANGPEMLCRWDMQMAPPDILVTNYSMLEYMLVRPIEAQIFELTRKWLKTYPGARMTLVLDEAHTYTGARGAEIAHLIRRLKERLDIKSGDGKLRCIATSASLPATSDAHHEICKFAADLFGEPVETFCPIVTTPSDPAPTYAPSDLELKAFSIFAKELNTELPEQAANDLLNTLAIRPNDPQEEAISRLYKGLYQHPQIDRARALTTRNAIQLEALATQLWGKLGTSDDRRQATAGVFAAGAMAREKNIIDAPPLISSRVHMMFRGIRGLWACMDPKCPKVPQSFRTSDRNGSPVGRLYTEPVPWCECGARVLEVFTCRVCGLMFLGGIPDQAAGSLWPWTDDLESGRPDLNDFVIFGVEEPGSDIEYRSIKTTRVISSSQPGSRLVYKVRRAVVNGMPIPFPNECPRCHNRRGRGLEGREIIEPLRTKGTKSFSVLVEDAFRMQPPTARSITANRGRKSLTFCDSRQDAAMLAGDLEIDHNRDLFRQMSYRLLLACPDCLGFGSLLSAQPSVLAANEHTVVNVQSCSKCNGSGISSGEPRPIQVGDLRERILRLSHRVRIDPTLDSVPNYFGQLTPYFNPNQSQASEYINAFIRNEIAAPDFGLEPMGLAAWRTTFPLNSVGFLEGMTQAETDELIDAVTRILATEDVLIPPSLDPRQWGEMVPHWSRNLLVPPPGKGGSHMVPFNPSGRRKLGRFLTALAEKLYDMNRIQGGGAVNQWLINIESPLFRVLESLGIVTRDANNNGYGINIDRFQLEYIGSQVHVCRACGYISNRAVLNTCIRCGGTTDVRPIDEISNYYRRVVRFASPTSSYPDPFSLKVLEHSGQIEKPEARNYELRFQDVFLENQDPDDVRIDILSVTTTMEMGIDIGNLLSVGMRNMPPSVANYQQRAGRAGRRGSGVASVLTYAQNRSHDQYYFSNPPRIVSDPPHIPRLHVDNRIIARRHVRALVLQRFFHQWAPTKSGTVIGGTLNAWGDIRHFNQENGIQELQRWIRANRLPLARRSRLIVEPTFADNIDDWITEIADEVAQHQQNRAGGDDVLGSLLDTGYLPRHAFPIDVVSLWTDPPPTGANYRERGVQRDLGIALSEFAPGAEIVRKKRLYSVVGLYDPYNYTPNYHPVSQLIECKACHAVQLSTMSSTNPDQCDVCGSHHLSIMPIIQPQGFCSEWTGPNTGGRRYQGGGRERAGTSTVARLAIGDDSFMSPNSIIPDFAHNLHVLVRTGDLHVINRGPDRSNPGFRICPQCGRNLSDNETTHTYPAHIPPFEGRNRGPRAGQQCSNAHPSTNRVLLGYGFPSEVILLGVDLPLSMDADVRSASGRAVWLSFGTLVLNAASRILNINPDDLHVDVRPVARPNGRVHGEVYLYDTLPGGAGYARDIQANLETILRNAHENSQCCPNSDCGGACYSCLLDYHNQFYHALLDRSLGYSILEYLLNNSHPSLTREETDEAASHLQPYLPDEWTTLGPADIAGQYFPLTLRNSHGKYIGILPRHALAAYPDNNALQMYLDQGIHCFSCTEFDLHRRPFWVINMIGTEM